MLCGYDIARMDRLPHVEGAFPDELIIAREHRSGYDHAARAAGARLVDVGFNEIVANAGVRRTEAWEYAAAIGPRTAGVLYGYSPTSRPPLAHVVAVAHEHGLPVLVDAAGELPPRENLSSIAATGADLVAFSGGKNIRGPQSTGILCGRRDLIASAALQMLDMDDHFELWNPPADFIDKSRLRGLPRHGIGRAHKVSKEQIVALLTALQAFCDGAYENDVPRMRALLEDLAAGLKDCPVLLDLHSASDTERLPSLEILIDGSRLGRSAFEVCRSLREGEPAVYVGQQWLDQGKLVIHPLLLRHDQLATLISRLRAALQPSPIPHVSARND
jgi:L-seryl-tRNA(Ser) seleniumtransferase